MIELQIASGKRAFLPFDVIEANVCWNNVEADEINVELVWSTKGKGTVDEYTACVIPIALSGRRSGNEKVKIKAPIGPYSFSGKLISLIWYVVARAKDDADYAEIEIVIAPEGKEIELPQGIQVV